MKTRVLTALILIPVVLVVMMSANPAPLFVLAALLSGISYWELSSFAGWKKTGFPIGPAILLAGFCLYAWYAPGFTPMLQLVGLWILGLLIVPSFVGRPSPVLLEVSTCWFVCPLLSLCVLQAMYFSSGSWWLIKNPLFVIVLPIWIGDTLAYFVGKRFGKHLLAPTISPKKTVEGAIANLVGCVIGAVAIGAWVGMPVWIAATCGVIGGTFGQAGDLFESGLKRSVGVKDAGSLLPGHGGVLDRIDSLLAAAPLEALLLAGFWPSHLSR